ncbi:MAG TPA: hypothetical protein VKA94_16885 [Hyphomicrobiales bacterium]|nr:hypothetical protein [Hyphomicrobiales bacterium]
MGNDETGSRSARKAIASGVLIALAGPPLGAVGFALMNAGGELIHGGTMGTTRLILGLFLKAILPLSYLSAGPAAALAGIIVGIAIYRGFWFSWSQWFLLMLALILVSIFTFEFLFGGANGPNPELIMWFIGSTIFAAIVLRATIVSLGWMRRPAV